MTQHTRNFSFKVLTINTHKGFTAFNKRFILPELRDAVRTVGADIVCLQEVMGAHEVHPLHIENWPDTTHYEFFGRHHVERFRLWSQCGLSGRPSR
ncbi:Endonuclease/Exonuclease/ phosphatase family protein [Salmonella enterica subsp. salamae]|uniref:Endonuclease/Exonuclease/ phosphatase family protein n=1 Tax=Salmonella enterica subsp. salamae TaxID=59202 RepID=A0A6D2GAN8_SALER|nr:Endonuclease/Exonuclease/ phosphatase family protein [Salmonella enterica subsp. salamae]